MKPLRGRLPILALVASLSTGACADLDVVQSNEPDRTRALAEPDAVVALLSGSYNTWFNGVFAYGGPGMFLSSAPFQHNSPWSCSTEVYSRIPRVAIANHESDVYYNTFSRPWFFSYRAITAASDALEALGRPDTGDQLTAGTLAMSRAFGRFSLGISHATLAALFDRGFAVDETVDVGQDQELLDYPALMEAAMGYFDEAIAVASSHDFALPYGWMQTEVDSKRLIRIIRSFKARFRAQLARTPEERADVNWSAVIADVDAGIQSTYLMEMDWNAGWYNGILDYSTWPSWSQLAYFVYGMADQSGAYQEWSALPLGEKKHTFADGRPVLIVTPDLRFPQGATVEEQRQATGRYFRMTPAEEEGNTWKRPQLGTWRWSWYKPGPRALDYGMDANFLQPMIRLEEMRLLKAEGLYHLGDLAGAAAIINETRVLHGLDPTDASGTNTSCVPKLPDGTCGDLWEMLKWEKRMETAFTGIAGSNWWFDGRGWGDLWKDSPLQFPVPCGDLRVLVLLPCNTYGGPGGEMGSPGSTYGYSSEGG